MRFKKIYIEITNICNKNCSFCSKNKRPLKEMNLDNFEYVLKEVKNFTDYIYLHVKGEPMIHSNFDGILDLCDKYKFNVNITTNGSLIKKNKDILKKHKCIRQMNISTHSMNDVSEINDVLESIEDVRKINNFYVVYRYWIIPSGYKLFNNKIMSEIIKFYSLDDDKINEIMINKNIKINEYTYYNKANEFEWPSLDNNVNNSCGFCLGLKSHIAILSDGTVVPCCLDADGKIPLGNIFEKSLNDILSSKFTLDIIEGFKDNKHVAELCRHCTFDIKN